MASFNYAALARLVERVDELAEENTALRERVNALEKGR